MNSIIVPAVDPLVLMEASRLCGTWERLRAFREQERRRLRTAGKKRSEANAESWYLAECRFRPSFEPIFDSFNRPPSLFRNDDQRIAWWAANRFAAVMCSVTAEYSAQAVEVIKATRSRVSADRMATTVPATELQATGIYQQLWEAGAEGFSQHVVSQFEEAIQLLVEGSALTTAVKREVYAWLEYLPQLIELAEQNGVTG